MDETAVRAVLLRLGDDAPWEQVRDELQRIGVRAASAAEVQRLRTCLLAGQYVAREWSLAEQTPEQAVATAQAEAGGIAGGADRAARTAGVQEAAGSAERAEHAAAVAQERPAAQAELEGASCPPLTGAEAPPPIRRPEPAANPQPTPIPDNITDQERPV